MEHIENRPEIDGSVVHATFADPNQLAEVSEWELDFRQIERGSMGTRIRMRPGEMLTLLEIDMDRGVHQLGAPPPGTVTLGVPLSDGITSWFGREIGSGGMLSFGGQGGFEGTSDRRFHGITFSFARSQFEAMASLLGMPIGSSIASPGSISMESRPMTLCQVARSALKYLESGQELALDRSAEEDFLAGLLFSASDHEAGADRSSSKARSRAVSVALELMEARLDEKLPLSEICGFAGVSVRTLNRAFVERFGIGPKAYHLRFRLGRMRRDLRNYGGTELISDIANKYGFWHMGQLAKDYKAQFGELPSQTVR